MTTQVLESLRFIRKTHLAPGEYRKNFHQIDREIIAAIASPDADRVTPLMSKIYLRLVNAPERFWEREGVLRIEAEIREGRLVKAWAVLCDLVGVAGATASKALGWMHEQGIIGYFSGKNGVGMRIFLNRASSSIGVRNNSGGKKILAFHPASRDGAPASMHEAAFNDSFAVKENLDKDLNPVAPKNGAYGETIDESSSEPALALGRQSLSPKRSDNQKPEVRPQGSGAVSVTELIERLKHELEPGLKCAAAQAAKQIATREIARTREWFETKALPKAVRVAQHETYDLLRKHGRVDERGRRARADLAVGRSAGELTQLPARPLTRAEIQETAETCVALLEVQGKPIDTTLAEIVSEGGWLSVEDAPRVREAAEKMLLSRGDKG